MNDELPPLRIIVEVVSSAEVKRLEARDDDVREEVSRLEGKLEGLHRTIYELLETIGSLRNKR